MLTSIRGIVAASLLAGGLAATPALAQDSEISISGNAAVVSDYRFRGLGLSGGDVAIQGGIDVGHSSGFYIGTWGSSLASGAYGGTELDIYGGWSGDLGGVTADVGVLYYAYPNAIPGDFDYVEFYASLGYAFGPVEATAGIAYAPGQNSLDFGAGLPDDNLYLYLDLGAGIPDTPLSLSAHIGYTDGALTLTGDNKAFDYSVGAEFAITDNLSIGVAYTGVEGPSISDVSDDAVVGTLSVSF